MPTDTQYVAAGANFTGLANAGLFIWDAFDLMPRTSRVMIHSFALAGDAGALDSVEFRFQRRVQPGPPVVSPIDRILLAKALGSEVIDPTTGLIDFAGCGRVLPRDVNGQHWRLLVFTAGGTAAMAAHVDWSVTDFQDPGISTP